MLVGSKPMNSSLSRLALLLLVSMALVGHAFSTLARSGESTRATGGESKAGEGGIITEKEIQALIDRETAAWDQQDAEGLVSLFHPDMVWPWPPNPQTHDPALWVFPQGRFNRERWLAIYENLFRTHELVHNVRSTIRILISEEGDGAFAVVDVDTLWRRRSDGELFHWKGRASKGYTKVDGKWLIIFHTGLLDYRNR